MTQDAAIRPGMFSALIHITGMLVRRRRLLRVRVHLWYHMHGTDMCACHKACTLCLKTSKLSKRSQSSIYDSRMLI